MPFRHHLVILIWLKWFSIIDHYYCTFLYSIYLIKSVSDNTKPSWRKQLYVDFFIKFFLNIIDVFEFLLFFVSKNKSGVSYKTVVLFSSHTNMNPREREILTYLMQNFRVIYFWFPLKNLIFNMSACCRCRKKSRRGHQRFIMAVSNQVVLLFGNNGEINLQHSIRLHYPLPIQYTYIPFYQSWES